MLKLGFTTVVALVLAMFEEEKIVKMLFLSISGQKEGSVLMCYGA